MDFVLLRYLTLFRSADSIQIVRNLVKKDRKKSSQNVNNDGMIYARRNDKVHRKMLGFRAAIMTGIRRLFLR